METPQHQIYLDWLRILSILGVLFFHSAMPYVAGDSWHIKNAQTSNLMMESNLFLHLIRMPLLFFISGTVSFYMMQRRSTLNFIGLRFRRLFIPLLLGIFIIVPPQIYMERLAHGFKGRYLDWYPSVFNFELYPKGSLSWHHLWFIAYLLIYDLILSPLFAWLISPKNEAFKTKIAKLSQGKRVYILTLPGIIWYALMSRKFPETNDIIHDGGYFVYWMFFLLTGFICIVQPKLMDSLERNRRFALTIGFLGMILLDYLRRNKMEPGHEYWLDPNELFMYLFDALNPIIAWSWVLAFIGYGKRYLNRKHKVLNYLNQAAYPFYILHQTVIVILAYYFVELPNESILSKYVYTLGTTFFVTVLCYHLFIRPFEVTRFLFGMKPKEKSNHMQVKVKQKDPDLVLSSIN